MTTKRNFTGLYMSTSSHWSTPTDVYRKLDDEFHFTLDPCPLHADFNGLAIDWEGSVFVNPPYGRQITEWIKKGHESAMAGAVVVMLIPSRTDTRWWHDYVMDGDIRFIKGRLKFGDQKSGAPFPSAIVIFRPKGIAA